MPEEHSLGDETPAATAPGSSPLGTPNPPTGAPPIEIPRVSIVDTILDLDALLSADVRRAEKTAHFCTKPWLEADIDDLKAKLDELVDAQGNPYPRGEVAVGEQGRTHQQVSLEIQTLQAEMGAAFRSVRMGQLSSDDWKAFKAKWREVLDKGAPYSSEFYDDLIAQSALRPPIPADKVAELRKKLGDPQMDELATTAWVVNTESGVSIPKSPRSSLVLRQAARAQS